MIPSNTYRETEILSASPGRLLVITYDGLLVSLTRLRAGAALGNDAIVGPASEKARAILCELLATLNREAGGALASQLAAIYAFLLGELDSAALRRDVTRLDRTIGLVRELRDAFSEAAAKAPHGPVS